MVELRNYNTTSRRLITAVLLYINDVDIPDNNIVQEARITRYT